jgi:hypothetical protein
MATAAWLCTYAIDQNAAMLVEVSNFLQNEWGGAVRPDWVRNRITFPRPIATEQGATEFDSSEGRARGSWLMAHGEIKPPWRQIKEPNMSKVADPTSFPTSGQLTQALQNTAALEIPAANTAEPLRVAPQRGPRERAKKSVVAMSFRISRQDWERLHQLAMVEGVSINTLTLRGLSKLFEERGLPGMTIG